MAWLTGWTYRKRIYISGSSGAGTGYQVKFVIGESETSPGCDFHLEGHSALFPSNENDSGDIRFTQSDGTTLLSLYVERVEGSSPNRVAHVWVKIDENLDSDLQIYVYYGNASATNVSDGSSVFEYFDDFSSDTTGNYSYVRLTNSKEASFSYNSSEERLDVDTGDDFGAFLSPNGQSFTDCCVHVLAQLDGSYPEGGAVVLGVRVQDRESYVGKILLSEYSPSGGIGTQTTETSPVLNYRQLVGSLVIFSGYRDTQIAAPASNTYLSPGQLHSVSFGVYQDTLKFFVDDQELLSATDSTISSAGNIAFGIDQGVGYVTTLFVRKFISSEPVYDYAGPEESQTPVVLDDIKLTDSVAVLKNVPVDDQITVSDSVDRYAYLRVENESAYIIHEWMWSPYAILSQTHSESPYSILVGREKEGVYSIQVSKEIDSPYSILVGRKNESEYAILSEVYNQSPYSILVGNQNISSYSIHIKKRHQSEYFIWEILKVKVVSEGVYKITDYNYLFIENQGRYEISLEGIIAVVDRYACISEPCVEYVSERSVHLHLYNTLTDERQGLTSSTLTHGSDRNAIVVRELIYDERSALAEVYYTDSGERKAVFGGYELHYDTREALTSSYDERTSERNTVAENIAHLNTERKVWFLGGIYNDYRYAFAKSWHVTERTGYTFGIPYTPVADQRYGWAQISVTKLEVIRFCYTESYSVKLDCVITPRWVEACNITINESFRILFENEKVTPYKNEFIQFPVNFFYEGTDLVLTDDQGTFVTNLAVSPVVRVSVERISSHTYRFMGYLIHRHKPLFTRIEFGLPTHTDFSDPNEYYKYLVRHGYLHVEIEGEEVQDTEALVKCNHPMQPIPIRIEMVDSLVSKVAMVITWGYPYRKLVTHKAHIYFRKSN